MARQYFSTNNAHWIVCYLHTSNSTSILWYDNYADAIMTYDLIKDDPMIEQIAIARVSQLQVMQDDIITGVIRRWRIRLFFDPCDFWIGGYWDKKKHTLYVCFLPCVVLAITTH